MPRNNKLGVVLGLGCWVLFGCSSDEKDGSVGTSGEGTGSAAGTGSTTHQDTGTGGDSASGGLTTTGGFGGATGGASSTGGAGTSTGGTVVPMDCPPQDSVLSVERLDATTVAELGTPFATDEQDLGGPDDWSTQYGKSPEIVPVSTGAELDILYQDQESDEFAYVVHVAPSGASYAMTHAYRVGSLGRIMGLSKDTEGNYYVATGVDEDDEVDEIYPPDEIHRSDIVRIVKFSIDGCVLMESDVDIERGNADDGSEIIVNPMVAATSRLVWGADRLLLVHGHNTEPDANIGGTRHQKAISTLINALDGSVTRTSTMWVSHSFDQRALFDGEGFVEMHLGDAYPRDVTLGRYFDSGGDDGYAVFRIKGEEGENNTYTRLGSLLQNAHPQFGYSALFATERGAATGEMVSGTRDLAYARIRTDFAELDSDEEIVETGADVATEMVQSSGQAVTNHVRWLTDLGPSTHAERPRMTMLDTGEIVVLFERYENKNDFAGTFALTIDVGGAIQAGPTEVPGAHHISRGDDIATLGGRAVYVTGGDGALYLNFVDAALAAERVALP